MKMEQTKCPETSAYKTQTSGNYPEENIQQAVTDLKIKKKKKRKFCTEQNTVTVWVDVCHKNAPSWVALCVYTLELIIPCYSAMCIK